MSEILKPAAQAMLDILKAEAAAGNVAISENGFATFDKSVAAKVIDMEAYTKTSEQVTDLVAAVGQYGADHFLAEAAKNKDLKGIEFSLPLAGNDAINGEILASKQYSVAGKTGTKYGSMTVELNMHANNKGAGQLAKVRENLSKAAAALLAD